MIAVLGAAGTVGRHIAGFLEEWGAEVVRRDFRLEGEEHVDAREPASLRAALEGVLVCVNSVDYRMNLDVMRACLDVGAHYVDLGGLFHMTLRQLELDGEFRAAGLTGILGLGSAPGKTNLLTVAGAARLGAPPVSLEIWAASRDPAAIGHPFPAPYSVQTLLDELQMSPVVLVGGELREVDPLSGSAERDLPEPVGRVSAIYTLHSELATLPRAFPTLREASFRLSLPEGLAEQLLALGDERPEPFTQSDAAVSFHLVEVGAEDGRSVTGIAVTRGGSARSTAEPAARGAVLIAEGRLASPGTGAPEAAIPGPEEFLALLDTEVNWAAAGS